MVYVKTHFLRPPQIEYFRKFSNLGIYFQQKYNKGLEEDENEPKIKRINKRQIYKRQPKRKEVEKIIKKNPYKNFEFLCAEFNESLAFGSLEEYYRQLKYKINNEKKVKLKYRRKCHQNSTENTNSENRNDFDYPQDLDSTQDSIHALDSIQDSDSSENSDNITLKLSQKYEQHCNIGHYMKLNNDSWSNCYANSCLQCFFSLGLAFFQQVLFFY